MDYNTEEGRILMDNNLDKNKHSGSRKALYSVFLVLLPLIILIVFELLLRLFGVGYNLNLFINHPSKEYKNYYMINPDIGEKYFTSFGASKSSYDTFLKKKSKNGYRVFVLGSSTIAGFPYGRNLMASRILHKRLEDAYPNKRIEVINTAITAINSITLRDYLNDIPKYKPDAIVFYAGHNEYYGAFGVGSKEALIDNKSVYRLHFNLMKLRAYQLIRKTIGKIATMNNTASEGGRGTLMKRIVADKSITYRSEKYYKGIEQFQSNLKEILEICNRKNIDVFLSDLVSNVKDQKPFGTTSVYSAIDKYNAAKQFEENKNYSAAKALYHLAKDYDAVRFRAADTLNIIINKMAVRYNCTFVPMQAAFENASSNQLVGDNLLTEHVHPNIAGQFVMAEAFFQSIVKSNKIDSKTHYLSQLPIDYYKHNWGYTKLDSLIGVHKVNELKANWPWVSYDDTSKTYRDNYTPTSKIDSLAFSILQQQDVTPEELHKKYAEDLFNQGLFMDAYWEYESLLRSNPSSSYPYNISAQCLLKLYEFNLAEKYFVKSLYYKDTFPAWLYLGDIYMLKHDYEKATEAFENSLKLAVDKKQKAINLQKLYAAYYYNKDTEQAESILTRLKEFIPNYNSMLPKPIYTFYIEPPAFIKTEINLAKKLIAENKSDSALIVLQSANTKWRSPYTLRMIGDVLYQRQDKKLLTYYNNTYSAYYKDPVFLARLCIANFVNGKKTETLKTLNELKELDPGNNAIKRLENLANQLE
jgi:Flp pilus assembly protein TadD/lysophospholipase L1-like esterase